MSNTEVRALSAPERRRKRGIITMAVLALFGFTVFGLLPKEGLPVTYSFVLGNEWIFVKEWIVNSKTGAILVSLLHPSSRSYWQRCSSERARPVVLLAASSLQLS